VSGNVVFFLLPASVAALAVMLDWATGRGHGLTLLVVFTLGISAWVLWSVQGTDQAAAEAARAGIDYYAGYGGWSRLGMWLLLVELCSVHAVAGLAALGVAALARQWRWLAGIAAGLLALAVIDGQAFSPTARAALGALPRALLVCAALAPGLAYGIWRIAHRPGLVAVGVP
jgi:hypothetical protein